MAAGLIAEAADRTGHTMPDEEAEYACLQALVSASVTLAGGRPHLVAVDRELATGTSSDT
ncbi:hypothetical protein [Streptomyces sp. NBC_01538]|uniref:hypothetical protein n=1 Tax=Streptomyces sp. NBC_01538 TaxID=2903897 RepID=UPI0038660074